MKLNSFCLNFIISNGLSWNLIFHLMIHISFVGDKLLHYIRLAFDASKDNILYVFKCDAQRKLSILCNNEKVHKTGATIGEALCLDHDPSNKSLIRTSHTSRGCCFSAITGPNEILEILYIMAI